ncbi:histidine kinase dimerization/phospho-acceptor domain-containing protein [Pseudoduganella sp.]|uniref:histidine kinase dimerization/phospho-acceptor domain-containing protein n=1 Tax=Pseudoduganella sp. TaxID=1880898 RepID=UPI0035B4B9E8
MKEPDQPTRFERLMALQDAVFSEWTSRVRSDVHRSEAVSTAVLIDTLPMFYRHLAALATGEASTYDRSTLATEHGGERARLTGFDAHSVAHELHLFRSVVHTIWRQASVQLSEVEVERVNNAIDVATRDTIAGFMLAQASFREQFFAALTHDLRTPIGTASMAVELIGETRDAHRVRVLAQIIAKQLTLMQKMVDDLLDTMVAHAGTAKRWNSPRPTCAH